MLTGIYEGSASGRVVYFRAMIKLNVREVAEAKGFANASALASATGVHRTSMYRIWDGAATRLDLETLDRLC
ncbi:MAG: helix-turn-helix domain-containing protein [Blastocatellia bacterium]